MATYGERLEEYRKDMGLLKEEMASLIRVSPQSYSGYIKKETSGTTAKKFLPIADHLGVSLDWLLGRNTVTKWGPDIQRLRLWLQSKAPEINAPNVLQRMIKVVSLMQVQNAVCREPWFMAGVLGLNNGATTKTPDADAFNAKVLQSFVDGRIRDIDLMCERLSRFTGLSEMWLMEGKPEQLTPVQDLGDYTNLILEMARRHMTAEDVAQNLDWLEKRMKQLKALTE